MYHILARWSYPTRYFPYWNVPFKERITPESVRTRGFSAFALYKFRTHTAITSAGERAKYVERDKKYFENSLVSCCNFLYYVI